MQKRRHAGGESVVGITGNHVAGALQIDETCPRHGLHQGARIFFADHVAALAAQQQGGRLQAAQGALVAGRVAPVVVIGLAH